MIRPALGDRQGKPGLDNGEDRYHAAELLAAYPSSKPLVSEMAVQANPTALAHRTEKCEAVFNKSDAQTKR